MEMLWYVYLSIRVVFVLSLVLLSLVLTRKTREARERQIRMSLEEDTGLKASYRKALLTMKK